MPGTPDIQEEPSLAPVATSHGPMGACGSARPLQFWDYGVLGVYSALVGWIILRHEAFVDEAQAWLIARDSSLIDLFTRRLHYEGTPGLWHLLLWLMSRLHVSYAGMHWMTGLLGVSAVYVLLRYSPFPPLIRRLIPFGFALVIQTAVVARSYSLLPLLLFVLCAVITSGRCRPMAFAVLAGLLANVSTHCVFLAFAMVPVYLSRSGLHRGGVRRASVALPGIVLTGFLLFACYTALPPPDVTYGIGSQLASNLSVAQVLAKITRTPAQSPGPTLSQGQPPPVADTGTWHSAVVQYIVWFVFLVPSLAFFVVSSSKVLAGVFYGVLAVWLLRHKVLIVLLPFATTLCICVVLNVNEHHASILWCSMLATLWLAWCPASTAVLPRVDLAIRLVLIAVLIEQVGWMAHAAYYDIRRPFDGGLAAYQFIESEPSNSSVAIFSVYAESLQPYSRTNLFFNQSTSYYPWRRGHDPDDNLDEVISRHPALIVDSEHGTGDVLWEFELAPFVATWGRMGNGPYLEAHGYHLIRRFCGLQPSHFGFAIVVCQVIYEPTSAVVAPDSIRK